MLLRPAPGSEQRLFCLPAGLLPSRDDPTREMMPEGGWEDASSESAPSANIVPRVFERRDRWEAGARPPVAFLWVPEVKPAGNITSLFSLHRFHYFLQNQLDSD